MSRRQPWQAALDARNGRRRRTIRQRFVAAVVRRVRRRRRGLRLPGEWQLGLCRRLRTIVAFSGCLRPDVACAQSSRARLRARAAAPRPNVGDHSATARHEQNCPCSAGSLSSAPASCLLCLCASLFPPMYSREEVKAITDKVINMAKADAVEVEFSGGERSATRFANSNITANMVQYDRNLSVTVFVGTRSATASTRDFDDASLKTAVDGRAEAGGRGARESRGAAAHRRPAGVRRRRRGAPERRQLRAGRARPHGQAEPRYLPEEGRHRVRLHPQDAPDDVHRQLQGTLRLLPVGRGELHPDVPHARTAAARVGRARRASRTSA